MSISLLLDTMRYCSSTYSKKSITDGLQTSYHGRDKRGDRTAWTNDSMRATMVDDNEGPTTRIKRYRATHKRIEIITAVLIVGIWIAVGAYVLIPH